MGDLRQFTVVNVKLVARMKTKVVGNVKNLDRDKRIFGSLKTDKIESRI